MTDQTDFSVVYFMSHKVHKPAATTIAGPNTEHSLSLWLYKKHVVKWKQNEEDRVLRLFFFCLRKDTHPLLSDHFEIQTHACTCTHKSYSHLHIHRQTHGCHKYLRASCLLSELLYRNIIIYIISCFWFLFIL